MKINLIDSFYGILNKLASGFSLIFDSVDGVDSYKSEKERFKRDSVAVYGKIRKRRSSVN